MVGKIRHWKLENEVLRRLCGKGSQSGQDLVEYALMAGFMALAVAATIPYAVVGPMRNIYLSAISLLSRAPN